MKKSMILGGCLFLLLVGCHNYATGVCRHQALTNAIIWKDLHPDHDVRICVGTATDPSGAYHAQTKYRTPGGEWRFLSQFPAVVSAVEARQDPFQVQWEYSIDEFIRYMDLSR